MSITAPLKIGYMPRNYVVAAAVVASQIAVSRWLLFESTDKELCRTSKYAAVTFQRPQHYAATFAFVEELASIGWHGLDGLMAAMRAMYQRAKRGLSRA